MGLSRTLSLTHLTSTAPGLAWHPDFKKKYNIQKVRAEGIEQKYISRQNYLRFHHLVLVKSMFSGSPRVLRTGSGLRRPVSASSVFTASSRGAWGCHRAAFGLPLPLTPVLTSAPSVSNTDVVVWVQASPQGQHPALHLQPSDTLVLDGAIDRRVPRGDTFSVKRTLTHQSGWVFNHCNCSILYKRQNIVYKT